MRRLLCTALIISVAGLGLPLPAQAGMLATPTVAASSAKDRILGVLERNDVRAQLQALGVNPADAKARVATLSDEEAAQLAARMDSLPAGGDGFGALIGAAVLIFLVLLLTDILGVTHVFSFTKPINK